MAAILDFGLLLVAAYFQVVLNSLFYKNRNGPVRFICRNVNCGLKFEENLAFDPQRTNFDKYVHRRLSSVKY